MSTLIFALSILSFVSLFLLTIGDIFIIKANGFQSVMEILVIVGALFALFIVGMVVFTGGFNI